MICWIYSGLGFDTSDSGDEVDPKVYAVTYFEKLLQKIRPYVLTTSDLLISFLVVSQLHN